MGKLSDRLDKLADEADFPHSSLHARLHDLASKVNALEAERDRLRKSIIDALDMSSEATAHTDIMVSELIHSIGKGRIKTG